MTGNRPDQIERNYTQGKRLPYKFGIHISMVAPNFDISQVALNRLPASLQLLLRGSVCLPYHLNRRQWVSAAGLVQVRVTQSDWCVYIVIHCGQKGTGSTVLINTPEIMLSFGCAPCCLGGFITVNFWNSESFKS
jgi:hypothetical protein